MKVKICGTQSIEMAETAITAGAHFLGFIFAPLSNKRISVSDAEKIINKIKGKINIVGVFQNQDITEVNEISDFLNLDYIQLHGNEEVDYAAKLKRKIIKAFSLPADFNPIEVASLMDEYPAKIFLLDRKIQGSGEMLDTSNIEKLVSSYKIMLAGGLTPDNVAGILGNMALKPYAVDVAGGIRTNNVPDFEKIRDFLKASK